MRSNIVLIAMGATLLTASALGATTFQTLYSFTGGADGATPDGGFAFDKAGRLYGVTYAGGTISSGCPAGCGTLFSVDPTTGKETVVHSFTRTTDGNSPNGGLIADANGVIYGTAGFGGANFSGTIFKYDPAKNIFTTLYSFANGGANPSALALDNQGLLYGTTFDGAAKNFGTIFQFNPATNKLTILHTFGTSRGEGVSASGSLTFDGKGAFYGATQEFGAGNAGTIFKIIPATKTLTTLYSFTGGNDGAGPTGDMKIGAFGLLIGQTRGGGAGHQGTIFAFNPLAAKLTTLYAFTGGNDGANPSGGVAFDSVGDLLGETTSGGAGKSGTIFKLNGKERLTILHAFSGGADGANPAGGLTLDSKGKIYGATLYGGTNTAICAANSFSGPFGCGTVFRIP